MQNNLAKCVPTVVDIWPDIIFECNCFRLGQCETLGTPTRDTTSINNKNQNKNVRSWTISWHRAAWSNPQLTPDCDWFTHGSLRLTCTNNTLSLINMNLRGEKINIYSIFLLCFHYLFFDGFDVHIHSFSLAITLLNCDCKTTMTMIYTNVIIIYLHAATGPLRMIAAHQPKTDCTKVCNIGIQIKIPFSYIFQKSWSATPKRPQKSTCPLLGIKCNFLIE